MKTEKRHRKSRNVSFPFRVLPSSFQLLTSDSQLPTSAWISRARGAIRARLAPQPSSYRRAIAVPDQVLATPKPTRKAEERVGATPFLRVDRPGTGSVFGVFDAT